MRIEDVWPEWHESALLGEGSFGKVFKAEREEFGEKFYSAIKVLSVPRSSQDIIQERKQGMNDYEIHEYFKSVVQDLVNEIVLMENLKGASNIVNIDDYRIIERNDEIGWDIFIRMELLTPFDELLNSPDYTYMDVLKMGVDICTALEMCEYNNIVHRDIKPDNIFISKYGEYKLGDFGISRQLDKTQANMSRKGTLNFMAPEVYKGESYGSSVDTYSLGLVMYKLLNNNRLPFITSDTQNLSFNDRQEAFEKRIKGERLPTIYGISQSLNYILQKACAYNPSDRYQSAGDLKNDLIAEMQSAYGGGFGETTMRTTPQEKHKSFNNTTNDMTSQGMVMVSGSDESSQDVSADYYVGNNPYQTIPGVGQLAKSSKVCRYLAIPFGLAIVIFRIFFAQYSNFDFSFASIAIAVLAVIAANNKKSMGIAIVSFSAFQAYRAFSYYNFSHRFVITIILCVASFLLLLGGATMFRQKEVRFSGMLCVYATVMILGSSVIHNVLDGAEVYVWPTSLIYQALPGATVFLWSYGYDSNHSNEKSFEKIIYFAAYAVSAICAIITLVQVAQEFGLF